MRVTGYDAIPEDEGLRRQWNELVLQMERPEIFYTYEWARFAPCSAASILWDSFFSPEDQIESQSAENEH